MLSNTGIQISSSDYSNYKEYKKLYDKQYRKLNAASYRKYAADYRKEHREQINKQCNEWGKKKYRENPEPKREYQRDLNEKRKDKIYSYYGGYRCSCCGESNKKFLTLDHINNDGKKYRRVHGWGSRLYLWIIKNNFPPIFQVLCYNCNIGKSRNDGVCPHKEN